ncbi:PREDICTED: histone H1x-like [Nanorana parkeri]|uniref:histone H1x-like n=1 Tax=Nanorana parkeri TaxID=125878 RepID=UPI0008549933|nr:PREDICTED: histone H1x-like [Nanorana parkeri]
MSLQLEENVPTTEEEEEEDDDDDEEEEEEEESDKRSSGKRSKAAAPSSSGSKKKNKKKNQPGRYSQLVVDTIRKLGERNGSSLAKIYSEAKKVSWFDQQNGRTYLKYSVKALVQNDTLVQVKGVGANGSFRLNKKKLEGGVPEKKAAPAPKPPPQKAPPKKSPKKTKAKPKPKKEKSSPKKSSPKPAPAAKSPKKKAASGGGKKVKKAGKPSGAKVHKTRKA